MRLGTGNRRQTRVRAVAAAELDGRPVVISGSGDRTVRVWDLATGTPVGNPFTGHDGPVNAIASLRGRGLIQTGLPAYLGVGTRHIATVYESAARAIIT